MLDFLPCLWQTLFTYKEPLPYTYIQLVNEVLVRLREREVTSVNDTAYSKLIGKFVNDAKRQAEDAYNWNALSTTLTADTTPGIFNYVLEGSHTEPLSRAF